MSDKLNQLLKLDVSAYTEKKGKLTYLSWANAWREFIKIYPDATYSVKKDENGLCWFGTPEHGYMAYTEVTAGGLTHEMWLPVMDHRNKAVLKPDSFQINKTVMRCLTKNLAMFGLGLNIFAGEDLPAPDDLSIKDQTSQLYADLIKKHGQGKLDGAIGMNLKKVVEIGNSGDESRITDLYTLLSEIK